MSTQNVPIGDPSDERQCAECVAPEQVVREAIDLWKLRYDPVVDGPSMPEAIVVALQEAGLL